MTAFNIPSDRMMTDHEVAKIKNCSVQTLRNNRHLGRGLSYYRDGRSIRYAGFDVAADIYRSRIDPEAAANRLEQVSA